MHGASGTEREHAARVNPQAIARLPPGSGPGPLRSVHTTVASMRHLCGSTVDASRLIPAVEFIRLGPCPDAGTRRAALAVTRSRSAIRRPLRAETRWPHAGGFVETHERERGARTYAAALARLPPASGPGPLRSVHTTVASMRHLCGSTVDPSRLIPAVEFIRLEPCPDPGARRAALAVTRSRSALERSTLAPLDDPRGPQTHGRERGARAYAAALARLPPASGPGPLRSVHTTVASMGHLCGSSVVASRLIPAVEFIRLEPCPDAGARRAALAVTRSRSATRTDTRCGSSRRGRGSTGLAAMPSCFSEVCDRYACAIKNQSRLMPVVERAAGGDHAAVASGRSRIRRPLVIGTRSPEFVSFVVEYADLGLPLALAALQLARDERRGPRTLRRAGTRSFPTRTSRRHRRRSASRRTSGDR